MTGPRRANWEVRLDAAGAGIRADIIALIDTERVQWKAAETGICARLKTLERRKRIESWAAVAYVVGILIYLAVTR